MAPRVFYTATVFFLAVAMSFPVVGAAVAEPAAPEGTIGAARRLTDPARGARRPRFSPDGRWIVFHTGASALGGKRGDVWIIGRDGSGLRQLTKHAADDRDPTWSADGARIFWSSNRAGTYDIWAMDVDGSEAERLTDWPGHELEPAVNPLRFTLFQVSRDDCAAEGVTGEAFDSYAKLALTYRVGRDSAVWFVSADEDWAGKAGYPADYRGRLSPEGKICRAPAWSGDGLRLTWQCAEDSAGRRGGFVLDGDARWDQDFQSAVKAVYPDGTEDPESGEWRGCPGAHGQEGLDACRAKLPRRYASFDGAGRSKPGDGLGTPTFSANQTVLLATQSDGGLWVRGRTDDGRWRDVTPEGATAVADADWSPDGGLVALGAASAASAAASDADGDGGSAIWLAETDFYLQDVKDLVDYPELWQRGPSARLHANRFVARPGAEKEFHELYDKVAYRRRAPFVTTDAALQVFHDEFTRLLEAAEHDAAADLLALCVTLSDHYAAKSSASDDYMAVLFWVPRVFLEAAAGLEEIDLEGIMWGGDEYQPPPRVADQFAAKVPAGVAGVPAALRPAVAAHVDAILEHAGLGKLVVPGQEEGVDIDWTQFKLRGHYASSDLAGYFIAMMWFGQAPLLADEAAFEFEALARTLPLTTPRAKGTVADAWGRVDARIGAFMGRPVDVTLNHLRTLRETQPALLKPFDREAVKAALRELRGPMPFRGLSGAMKGGRYPLRVTLFPRRYGLDAEFFSQLTHPDVPGRGMPSLIDALAALGVSTAREHAAAAAAGEGWAEAYRARLDRFVGEAPGRLAGYATTDLYHGWLALTQTLATPPELPSASTARVSFARSGAWADRLLHSGLAALTKLKHQAVLYAFADYGVECDSGYSALVFVEQPILSKPRGSVDPHPRFFDGLAALAKRAYAALGDGEEPTVEDMYELFTDPESGESPIINARTFAERLAVLARKELKGEALSDDDHAWLRMVAPLIESMFITRSATDDTKGADIEGRAERGVAIATDIYTNVQRGQVVQEALGRLLDLYVVVDDGVGSRMTQGGLFSYYEFTQPMDDRLDDASWGARVQGGELPPAPAWTSSFLESAP